MSDVKTAVAAPPKAEQELIVAYGGDVKAMSNGKIKGFVVRFGGPPDKQGDCFAADGDYGLDDLKSVRLLYHHGMGKFGKKRIGTLHWGFSTKVRKLSQGSG